MILSWQLPQQHCLHGCSNVTQKLAGKLAQRYGANPQVTCWHINNEYGGECYCENCEKAFRVWLKDKYQTIEALNKAWNLEFWGHTVYEWDEIVLPNALSEGIGTEKTAFAGISIDYRRFNSDSLLENFKLEKEAIRQFDSQTPITTNLMGTFKGLDYFKWAKEMDIVSWDNYPSYNTPWSFVAMTHDLMRGLKQAPFMLMEQTPSQQNWQPYNSLKKPGQMRAQSYQTIAHGADTIQFFQLRRSIGACEKFHGAVIEHVGHENTRVFKETAALGEELSRLSEVLGSNSKANVGVIFDWDNYWALEYTSGPTVDLTYVQQIHQYYQYFYEKNIATDLIAVDGDFSKYQVIVAPVLYMVKEGMSEALAEFVKQGGTLITTYMSGIVDQSDNVHLGGYPGPLRELAGIWVEEIDALAPEQTNAIKLNSGKMGTSNLVSEIIHLETAEFLAEYASNFYAGTPAVTRNHYGDGQVYYVGTQLENELLTQVLDEASKQAGIHSTVETDTNLEISCRQTEEATYYFVINFNEQKEQLPAQFVGRKDLLSGVQLTDETVLNQYDVYIIKEGAKG
jgi:beta-galactosidase